MDIRAYNREAWNRQVVKGNRWTVPVTAAEIAEARQGRWQVVLTPQRPVPRPWFGDLAGRDVLGLASAGGQQGPILAAAGARVVVFDNSPAQLARDREVAEREGLDLRTVEGDMADLGLLADSSFDLIFHPVSNVFAPDVRPVWRECFRVLRPGGALLAGFITPAYFIFDDDAMERGELCVRHTLPYSDLTHLTEAERQRYIAADEPLVFGHTLEEQIGAQLLAGFRLTALYEDGWPEKALGRYMPCAIATRAVRPPPG